MTTYLHSFVNWFQAQLQNNYKGAINNYQARKSINNQTFCMFRRKRMEGLIILFPWFRNYKLCNRLKVSNTRNMRLFIIVWQHPYVHFHFYFLYLWLRKTRHVRENEARLLYLNIKCGSYATDEIMDEIYSHRVKTNQEFLKFSVF